MLHYQSLPTYPLETHPLEIERLRVQSAAMAADAELMLNRLGVQSHWQCLDLGCGPFGLANILSPMAARVTGLDKNETFLDYARRNAPVNAEFVHGDVYDTGLPAAS